MDRAVEILGEKAAEGRRIRIVGDYDIDGVCSTYLLYRALKRIGAEVYITIYLDRWDADAERWRQVTYYDAEFYAKDYPDGLTDPTVDITFLNQVINVIYHLEDGKKGI